MKRRRIKLQSGFKTQGSDDLGVAGKALARQSFAYTYTSLSVITDAVHKIQGSAMPTNFFTLWYNLLLAPPAIVAPTTKMWAKSVIITPREISNSGLSQASDIDCHDLTLLAVWPGPSCRLLRNSVKEHS